MSTHGGGLLRAIFEGLRDWFGTSAPETISTRDRRELPVAVATLLASIVRVGSSQRPPAWAAAAKALAHVCRIDADDAWALLGAARERASNVSSYTPAVSVLNKHWPARQKLRFTRKMWQVARADGRISYHQDRLVHRLAEELDVAYADVVAARDRWFP